MTLRCEPHGPFEKSHGILKQNILKQKRKCPEFVKTFAGGQVDSPWFNLHSLRHIVTLAIRGIQGRHQSSQQAMQEIEKRKEGRGTPEKQIRRPGLTMITFELRL